MVPLLVSNCFLENFSQSPNVLPQLEGSNLPEKAAAKREVGSLRDLLVLPALQSQRGLAGAGSRGSGQTPGPEQAWKLRDLAEVPSQVSSPQTLMKLFLLLICVSHRPGCVCVCVYTGNSEQLRKFWLTLGEAYEGQMKFVKALL